MTQVKTHGFPYDRAPHVLLGVTGCIAAYKSVELMRQLQKSGCEVRVILTEHAEHFIGKATFDALSDGPCVTSLFDDPTHPIAHIELTSWADLVVVVPATANTIAKAASGIADDALSSALLAADSPVLVVPAMNTRMWHNPATQANIETLKSRGIHVLSPASGLLACGDIGEGKLPEISAIFSAAVDLLQPQKSSKSQVLAGRRVLITAGPTHEAIDPVRYIANASSGIMGYALAEAARDAGATVELISGPTALDRPLNVTMVEVTSAQEMYDCTLERAKTCDIVICAAAVADYTPADPSDHKLKKGAEELTEIKLVRTPDILAAVSKDNKNQYIVGFAAETDNLIANAQAKLAQKGCNLIVANDVSQAESTFGSLTNHVYLVSPHSVVEIPVATKQAIAASIIEYVGEAISPVQD